MDAGCSFEPPDIGTWSRDPLGDFVDVLVFFVLLTQVGPGSVVRKSGSGDQSCLLTCVLLLEGGGHVLSRPLSLVHWWHGAACHSSLSAGAAFSSCCRRVFFLFGLRFNYDVDKRRSVFSSSAALERWWSGVSLPGLVVLMTSCTCAANFCIVRKFSHHGAWVSASCKKNDEVSARVLEPLHRARPFGQGSSATPTPRAFGSKGCVQLVQVVASQHGLLPAAA